MTGRLLEAAIDRLMEGYQVLELKRRTSKTSPDGAILEITTEEAQRASIRDVCQVARDVRVWLLAYQAAGEG